MEVKSKNSANGKVKRQAEKEYADLIHKAQKQPGINDLLRLYGRFDEGLRKSQEYLDFMRPIESSTASNSSSPS